MLTFAILLSLCVVLLITYLYKFTKKRHNNFPPGPPRLPLWGSYWFMLKENYNFPHLSLEIFAKRYKTDILGLYLGDTPTVVTFSSELTKELLTRDEFIGRNDTIITRTRGLGEMKGIFFIDGPFWKEERRYTLRTMRDQGFGRRSHRVEDFFTEEIKHIIDIISGEPSPEHSDIYRSGGFVLVPDIFYGPLFNSILQLLSSTRFDDLKLREVARTALRFQRSGDATGNAISMTPWLRHVAPKLFGFTEAVESNTSLLTFVKEIIDNHIESFSDDYHRDFIDAYFSERLKEDQLTDFNQLLLTVLDYFFPAAIAIGHTLNFYFSYIVNNKHVQMKIQEEIERVVGRSRLPCLDDRKEMPYLEASLREAIRILPLNPLGIPRRCMEDTTLAGYFIPKDTIMLPCVWSAHKDPLVWTRPEEFLPERFLDRDGNLLKKDNTMGFGAGKRLCAGETFARHHMFLLVSSLLQSFTFESADGKPINLEKNSLVPGANLSLRDNWVLAVPRNL